jgi:hypothetical protein
MESTTTTTIAITDEKPSIGTNKMDESMVIVTR